MTNRNAAVLKLLFFASFLFITQAFQKTVEIDLVSKWPTPLIAEISEFFAKKGNQNFWLFVESLKDEISYQDDKETYEKLMLKASSLLSPSDLSFLKLSSSIRYYSPLVYASLSLGRSKAPKDCSTFLEIGGTVSCDLDNIPSLVQSYTPADILILENDHKHPNNLYKANKQAILYGRIGTPSFYKSHLVLSLLASEGKLDYVFRHYQQVNPTTSLSGYGVELAIKNTEYKATDDTKIETKEELIEKDKLDIHGFNFSVLKDLHQNSVNDLESFKSHLLETPDRMTPLKVWQLQDLSLQAGQKVMLEDPSNQLTFLKDLCQNFPSKARELVKVKVNEEFKTAMKENQINLHDTLDIDAGDDYLLINGLKVDIDVLDMFSLLDLLQREHNLVLNVAAIINKYKTPTLQNLIYIPTTGEAQSVDYGLDIRTQSVFYMNDLEKDKQYNGWPSSVSDLLRPAFPGMLRHLRKNLFNLVYFFDPLDKSSHDTLSVIESFYNHMVPTRIGLVFVKEDRKQNENDPTQQDEEKEKERDSIRDMLVQAFCHIKNIQGSNQAFGFLKKFRKLSDDDVTEAQVEELMSPYLSMSITTTIVNHQSDCYVLQESTERFKSSGLGASPKVLVNGVPMSDAEVRTDFEESLVQILFKHTSLFQRDVFDGRLKDSLNTLDYLMENPNIKPRINTHLFNCPLNFIKFDLTHEAQDFETSKPDFSIDSFKSLSNEFFTEAVARNLHYITKNEDQEYQLMTWWLVADLETSHGRTFFSNALKHLKRSKKIRIGLLHNTANKPSSLSLAIQAALQILPHNVAKNYINKLLKEENAVKIIKGKANVMDFTVGNMDIEAFKGKIQEQSVLIEIHSLFCRRVLSFDTSQLGIVSNGRVYGPFSVETEFIEQDFELMEALALNKFTESVEKYLKAIKNITGAVKSDLSMRLESLFYSPGVKATRKKVYFSKPKLTTIHIAPSQPQDAALNIIAIFNPASKAAQKIVPIIMVLNELFNTDVTIFFNCKEKLSEMPLKSYYRFVLEPEVMFKESSMESFSAYFSDLPHNSLLTLNMHTPESWLVESIYSPYDLDNILLSEADTNVYAQFELDKILLEGHCYDTVSGSPPRGLQFTLGNNNEQMVDTIVMANLGYFQLKASPGLWFLGLREGKSRDLYHITSVDEKLTSHDQVLVSMDSFKGKTLQVKVTKQKGKELEELLSDDEDEGSSLWQSFSSKLGGGSTKTVTDDQINVFSLASGHLYERFLRVMMLSVIKNTKSKVKFWFLKNYLSPTFKNFIPHMAAKYNFEYELVQYKWPRWLHQQTEKQRVIWGYKILFLDVLFPLNVSKIIFVDADQTVRADLKELNELDLEGAPYGYTPFCDSRKDMDGYRFWRSGYWANHLGYRKYHISALYVVDLKKFRKVAAGDRLRGQYQGLSQDPNSLSNLDQDLPNNMIHQVGIKSLPQEWLWCETWCSDEEKTKAKTIDLCNNPKTKEPKLDAALRIVAEWKDNDNEIKQLMDAVNRGEKVDEKDDEVHKEGDEHTEL